MLDWFIPENTGVAFIVIVLFAITITFLMRKQNIAPPVSRTRQEAQGKLAQQYNPRNAKCPLFCPLSSEVASLLCDSQPNVQHQPQETNKTKHELSQV